MPFGQREVEFATTSAMSNWLAWQSTWEFRGRNKGDIPVLACEELWDQFRKEYSVARTVRTKFTPKVREYFRSSAFIDRVMKGDVTVVDARIGFLAQAGEDHPRSMISKIVTFMSPVHFLAYDESAKAGAARMMQGKKPKSYVDYMKTIESAWQHADIQSVRRIAQRQKRLVEPTRLLSFERRVFDVCLMIAGGRYKIYGLQY